MSSTTPTVKVMIVDNQIALRTGLRVSLPDYGIEVICEASDGNQALELLKTYSPAVLILEIRLQPMNGLELLAIIKLSYPLIKTIIYTSHPDYFDSLESNLKLADFAMIKGDSLKQLVANIMTLSSKEKQSYMPLDEVLMNAAARGKEQIESLLNQLKLTARELEVLQLFCNGLSTKDIAAKMDITASTVEFHKENIYKKTGTKKAAELGAFAVKYRLISV